MLLDGGTEEDLKRMRRSRGTDGAHGYRPFTRKDGPVTQTVYAKIRESDVPGLIALVTDGRFGAMPTDAQEVEDLRNYLIERYS